MTYNNSVFVNKKGVTVVSVACVQNVYQLIKEKIYCEHAQKFTGFAVNNLRKSYTIQPRLNVEIGRGNVKALIRINRINVPLPSFGANICGRFPAVIHNDRIFFVGIGNVANRNIFVINRQIVQEFNRAVVIFQSFGIGSDNIDERI